MAKHVITPAWQTQRGSVVQAAGCAAGVPVAGAKVFGETRQNLWPRLSGSSRGVSVSTGEDGAVSLSGTATDTATVKLAVHTLQPGKTYTLSVDKAIPGVGDGYGIYVDTDVQAAYYVGNSERLVVVYTTDSSATSFTVGVYIPAGVTVSGTYRVMLNEGPTAQPWCPPGLTSVGELETVTAGKNLLRYLPGLAQSTTNGITFTPQEDGGIKVQGTASSAVYFNIDYVSSYESAISNARPFVGRQVTASKAGGENVNFIVGVFTGPDDAWESMVSTSSTVTATVPDDALAFRSILGVNKDITVDTVIYPQFELGSTATAYEPPAVTTTPIDLSGHELRSLPDGTRDVLSVDGSGAVSVEQACAEIVLDGSQTLSSNGTNRYQTALPGCEAFEGSSVDDPAIMCDALPVSNNTSTFTGSPGVHRRTIGSQELIICVPASWGADADAVESYLASHPVTVAYPLADPQTVPLDPITPPSVPAAEATLWAASDVPCDLEATTWTASGAEQGRQQAAMVKVAQQVRQQAETVAALTTQALEA